MADALSSSFFKLTTDRVLNAVESALASVTPGLRATGRLMALNSLENRVYDIELEDNTAVVAKFYRPGRWNEAQISEEHQFLAKLHENEIPVVGPVLLGSSKDAKLCKQKTLAATSEGIFFAVFPKVKGRLVDELSKTQLETLGRYVGRIHGIGKTWPCKHRLQLTTKNFGATPLEFLQKSKFLDVTMRPHYLQIAEAFLKKSEERLAGVPLQVVHGDCHLGNTLWQGEAPFFLDFDDMMLAPAVQDIWMIIRGRDDEAKKQREILLAAYEQMNEFNYSTLNLIEVLRGLRIIHYSAWIAKRWEDPSFPQAFPQFASQAYWRSEIEALQEILELVNQSSDYGNY